MPAIAAHHAYSTPTSRRIPNPIQRPSHVQAHAPCPCLSSSLSPPCNSFVLCLRLGSLGPGFVLVLGTFAAWVRALTQSLTHLHDSISRSVLLSSLILSHPFYPSSSSAINHYSLLSTITFAPCILDLYRFLCSAIFVSWISPRRHPSLLILLLHHTIPTPQLEKYHPGSSITRSSC